MSPETPAARCLDALFRIWAPDADTSLTHHLPDIRVLTRDGSRVGTVALRAAGDAAITLANIHVDPERQGEGIGRETLQALLEQADLHGCDVVLEVFVPPHLGGEGWRAGWYRSLGFEPEGEAGEDDLMGMRRFAADPEPDPWTCCASP